VGNASRYTMVAQMEEVARSVMSGSRLDLANPNAFESPKDYVEKHLGPLVTELNTLVNELFSPGSTSAEEWAVDMTTETPGAIWQRLDKRVEELSKHVVFDGSAYFSLPKELLRAKQAKVLFTAALYTKGKGEARFRLVRDDGAVVGNSVISVSEQHTVATYTRHLPFGLQPDSISPDSRTYYIEACSEGRCVPVCRRFSLSFVYI
jgi:hypothetical protein